MLSIWFSEFLGWSSLTYSQLARILYEVSDQPVASFNAKVGCFWGAIPASTCVQNERDQAKTRQTNAVTNCAQMKGSKYAFIQTWKAIFSCTDATSGLDVV